MLTKIQQHEINMPHNFVLHIKASWLHWIWFRFEIILHLGKTDFWKYNYQDLKFRNLGSIKLLSHNYVSAAYSTAGKVEWGKECSSEGWPAEPGERETNVHVVCWLSADPAAVTEARRRTSAGKWKGMGLLHLFSFIVIANANYTSMMWMMLK